MKNFLSSPISDLRHTSHVYPPNEMLLESLRLHFGLSGHRSSEPLVVDHIKADFVQQSGKQNGKQLAPYQLHEACGSIFSHWCPVLGEQEGYLC